jgi:GAF domain-containing protein
MTGTARLSDTAHDRAVETLVEIARAINSDLPPDRMLEVVVRTTRELLDADRATVLLLDDDGQLTPEVSVARRADVQLWTRFRDMPPIPVSVDAEARLLLVKGAAIVIPHAAESTLVPREWQRAFGLQSLIVAPLVVMGEPCGALVVDDERTEHFFEGTTTAVVEGIAALTAIALRHARRHSRTAQQARTLDQLLSLATGLNRSPELHRVLQTAVDGFLQVFGATSCSISTLDADDGIRCLASRGAAQPEPGVTAASLCSTWLPGARRTWATDPTAAVVVEETSTAAPIPAPRGLAGPEITSVVVPFTQENRVRGFARVVLCVGRGPEEEQLTAAVSLAGQVWLAIERARLAEDARRRADRIEALYNLSHEIALLPDMRLLVERLAPAVREATGGEILDVVLCDSESARIFSSRTPRGTVAGEIRQWRKQDDPRPCVTDGLYSVPMVLAGGVVGALRVRAVSPARLPRDGEDFLLAVGAGVADVVSRIVLRTQIAATERELAVAEERGRLTAELHGDVGSILLAASARLELVVASVQDAAAGVALRDAQAEIGRTGRQLRGTVAALGVLQRHRSDLAGSLRELVATCAAATGVDAGVRVVGRAHRLAPLVDAALLRVAHECLTTLGANSHATTVMLHLRYASDGVELVVHDDGVHLAQRASGRSRAHTAIRAMQVRLDEVAGSLAVTDCAPSGMRVTAWVDRYDRSRAAPRAAEPRDVTTLIPDVHAARARIRRAGATT